MKEPHAAPEPRVADPCSRRTSQCCQTKPDVQNHADVFFLPSRKEGNKGGRGGDEKEEESWLKSSLNVAKLLT